MPDPCATLNQLQFLSNPIAYLKLFASSLLPLNMLLFLLLWYIHILFNVRKDDT